MKRLWFFAFLAGIALVQIALTNLAADDWIACLYQTPLAPTFALLLPQGWIALLLPALTVSPLVTLAFGAGLPDRVTWLCAIALLLVSCWLLLPPGAPHDSDRKGTSAEFAFLLLLPVSFLVTTTGLLTRITKRR